MQLVKEEILEVARVFLPPGVKVTQTAEGGQGEGVQMQLNASRVDAQEGPPFTRQIQERRPREQSMLEAPTTAGAIGDAGSGSTS